MFGVFLSYTVADGLHNYMKAHNIESKNGNRNHFDFIQVLYENYANWDDETKIDKPLPGILFSNKNMFWFTLIHKNCVKLQKGNSFRVKDFQN